LATSAEDGHTHAAGFAVCTPPCPDKLSVLDQAGSERALRGRNLGNHSAFIYARNNKHSVTRCFHLGPGVLSKRHGVVVRSLRGRRIHTQSRRGTQQVPKLGPTSASSLKIPAIRSPKRDEVKGRALGVLRQHRGSGCFFLAASAQTQHRWAASSIAIEY
jgi:hypothetical protein